VQNNTSRTIADELFSSLSAGAYRHKSEMDKTMPREIDDHGEAAPIGVMLLNMGGPSTLAEVPRFLRNLFSDREIIRLGPAFLQKPLARLIAARRAPKSMAAYQKIGGGSPLLTITQAQADALVARLGQHGSFVAAVAMRYTPPFTEQALDLLKGRGVQTIVAVSLYPHYSRATSGSSLNELNRLLARNHWVTHCIEIDSWPDHPGYIDALCHQITRGLARFGDEPVTIVYSAHSLPVSFIEQGDPYVEHVQRTISAIETKLGISGRLCYQSRSGPVTWLSPSTPEMITTLAHEGRKNILMVPISFVSDHIETLYEISILYREMAARHHIRLEQMESLNTEPLFIDALASLVLEKLDQQDSSQPLSRF
jgi:ferrochelatase